VSGLLMLTEQTSERREIASEKMGPWAFRESPVLVILWPNFAGWGFHPWALPVL
jgi:hypothetical protein